jgi:hypothetical protein
MATRESMLMLWARELLSRIRVRSAERRLYESGVHLACERIIAQVNPALRSMPGYRRRLFPAAERLLQYSEELVRRIPGPLTLDPSSWAEDPLVNALFGSPTHMRQVLSGREVQRWLKEHPIGDGDLYGLLAAVPEERNQLGMELVGDQVQRDIKQTTLSFSEQQIGIVSDSMDGLRRALVQPLADIIVGIGHGRIEQREERIAALEESLRMLRLKLKVVDPRVGGLDLLLNASTTHVEEQARLKARIEETERDLADARRGLGDIAEYLDYLIAELDHPEKEVQLETMALWLDRMNVVRDSRTDGANEIRLVRARRPDRPGRVVQFVRFPRSLVQARGERLDEVARQIGA